MNPPADCALCARLVSFRHSNQAAYPGYANAPVPSFGAAEARRLVVGLAPGFHGANRSARPFTGDYAGDVLYAALKRHGLASGAYGRHAADGFTLRDVRVTNAVRCVPPGNKPQADEVRTCGRFLQQEIAAMPHLTAILALGRTAHASLIRVLGGRQAVFGFAHGACHDIGGYRLYDSYHTSRYNLNTGRLSEAMFDAVVARFASQRCPDQ